ncbi:MAG: hypothetical protein R2910_05625 [Gemmatimonadales bacterium]
MPDGGPSACCWRRAFLGGVLPLLLLALRPCAAHAQWAVEGFLGTSFSAHSPLTIYQAGKPTLHITADYATNPRQAWIYYAFRVSRWWGRWGGTAGFIHQKVYLTNPPPEVQEFRVTNGYNLFSVGAGYLTRGWSFLGGLGPVIANPANTVRGLPLPDNGGGFGTGYYLSGVNLQLGVNRRFYVVDRAFLTVDVTGTAAWASVDVVNGHADTPNYALNLLFGVGWGGRRPGVGPAP